MSKKYTLNKEDLLKIFKVALWSGLAAAAVVGFNLIAGIELPVEYAFAGPIINTVGVAVVKFLNDKVEEVR